MKLEKKLKRLLSVTLALCMILSIVQFTSLAAAEDEQPQEHIVCISDEILGEDDSDEPGEETPAGPQDDGQNSIQPEDKTVDDSADGEESPIQSGDETTGNSADGEEAPALPETETAVGSGDGGAAATEDEAEIPAQSGDEDAISDEVPALPEYGFTIQKVDAGDGSTLAGAKFLLFRERDGEWYSNKDDIYTTDESGEVAVGSLPAGVYYLVEMKAPDNYERTNDYWKIIAGTPETSAGFASVKGLILAALEDRTDDDLREGLVPEQLANGGTLTIENEKKAVIATMDLAGEDPVGKVPETAGLSDENLIDAIDGDGAIPGTLDMRLDATLDDPFQFGVYANRYNAGNHIEGNVAVIDFCPVLEIYGGKSYIHNFVDWAGATFQTYNAKLATPAINPSDGVKNPGNRLGGHARLLEHEFKENIDTEIEAGLAAMKAESANWFAVKETIPGSVLVVNWSGSGSANINEITRDMANYETLVLNISPKVNPWWSEESITSQYSNSIHDCVSLIHSVAMMKGKYVVVNIDYDGKISIVDEGGFDHDEWPRHILWNIGNSNDVYLERGLYGIILAPNATVFNTNNIVGTVIANVYNQNGEIHQRNWDGPPPPPINKKEEPGSLTVTKKVEGGNTNEEFEFTVKLTDSKGNAVTGPFQATKTPSTSNEKLNLQFTGGVETFKLKNGESMKIEGIPAGTKYEVTESTRTDYTASWEGNTTGNIAANSNVALVCTNTKKPEYGSLEVTKRVEGGNTNEEFEFTVKLTDSKGNAVTGPFQATKTPSTSSEKLNLPFTGGVETFKLKNGESMKIEGIPAGAKYEVTESTRTDYTARWEGDTTGNIAANSNVALVCTNTKKPEYGSLEVTKKVEGGNTNEEFEFTVKLTDSNGNAVTGPFQATKTPSTSSEKLNLPFTGGVETFKLKNGESMKIEGIPAGAKYEVSESARTDYTARWEGDTTGDIAANSNVALVCTNTKQQPGSLTVTKTAVGGNADDVFEFTVTLTDSKNNRVTDTYDTIKKVSGDNVEDVTGNIQFTNGEAKITLKRGESMTIEGIPFGFKYKVEESANNYYTLTSESGVDGTINSETPAIATFTNTRETGDLTVTKTVVGGNTDDAFEFTVALKDAAGNAVTGEFDAVKKTGASDPGTSSKVTAGIDGKITFDLADGESMTITGIPTGTKYEVTETPSTGYTASWTNNKTTSEIEKNSPAVVTCTNTRETGELTVTKTVVGGNTDDAFEFTVALKDAAGNAVTGEFDAVKKASASDPGTSSKVTAGSDGKITFDLADGESMTITGIPTGTMYEVTETPSTGYTASWTNNKTTSEIEKNSPAVVAFTNTRETGELVVTKTVVNSADVADDTRFDFEVTLKDAEGNAVTGEFGTVKKASASDPGTSSKVTAGSDGKITFDLADGESMTITGIPTGTRYEVTETPSTGYTASWTNNKTTSEIEKNSPAVVAFTNTRETGELTIHKTVDGDHGELDKDFTFTVTLTDSEDSPIENAFDAERTLSDGTIQKEDGVAFNADGKAIIKLKHNESITITGIPTGFKYAVEEDGYPYYTAASSETAGTIEKEVPAVVEFTNTRGTGELVVTKTVEKGGEADNKREFTFTVTLTDDTINGIYGGMEFTDGKATFTLKHGETKTATGLPAGVGYQVIESDNEAYMVDMSGDTGTIEMGGSATAAFTNTPFDGSLIVSKTVVGVDADREREFTFTVTLDNNMITGTYGDMYFENGVATFTLKHGEYKTATGIPAGIKYTVEESPDPGYTTTSSNETGTIAESEPATVVFTNTLKTGDLTVRKTVADVRGADTNKPFTFTVTLGNGNINGTYGGMTFTNGVATFTLRHGESVTATGLPAGVTYTVQESNNAGYAVTSTGETGTIREDQPAVADFTNTFMTGSLQVTKTVFGAGVDVSRVFTFTVRLSDASINGEYGGMKFTNGVATVGLRHGDVITATELPAGITYTVEEAPDDEYFVSSSSNIAGTINGAVIVEFTNGTREPYISTIPDWPDIPTFDIPRDRTPQADTTYDNFMTINDTQTPLDFMEVNNQVPLDLMTINDQTPLDFMNIDDILPPLDDIEEELLDLDIDVPLDQFIPQTGDDSAVWLIAAAASAFGLVVLFFADRKKEEEEA